MGTETEREREEGWKRTKKREMGTGTGVGTGVETGGKTQDGNGGGSGDKNESSRGDENGDKDGNGDKNEDRIGEGREEAKKRKKSHKKCRRDVGNGQDLSGKRRKRRQERVGYCNPDHLETRKDARGERKVPRAYVRTVQGERMCPLCRV